jgi:hypothetical protein
MYVMYACMHVCIVCIYVCERQPCIEAIYVRNITRNSLVTRNPLNLLFHVHVDGVRLCLWTAATKGFSVLAQLIYVCGEQRWNDIDRGKPSKSEEDLFHCHFVRHNPTWKNWVRNRVSAVRGWRLTAWAMARSNMVFAIHSQALIVQDGPLASLLGFIDLTHTDTR